MWVALINTGPHENNIYNLELWLIALPTFFEKNVLEINFVFSLEPSFVINLINYNFPLAFLTHFTRVRKRA